MKGFLEVLNQYYHLYFSFMSFSIICLFLLIYAYKLKRMFDIDEKNDRSRNIWDLGILPPLSRLFFKKDWKLAIAVFLLILVLFFYLFTKDILFADLLKISFGIVIGALIGKKIDEPIPE